MRNRQRLAAVLVTVGILAVGCGGDDDSGGSGNGGDSTGGGASEITIALGSEPTSLDPYLVDDGGERAINDNIYETLLTRTPEGELAPGLATELPTQVDDTTWEFKLQENVTFHDGSPFNADSVVASVERIVRLVSEAQTDLDGFFGSITGATKVDDTTVRITTAESDGVLPARMYWLKMIPASAADAEDLSDDPVGTGPYKFGSYQPGSSITLEVNEDYWGDAPDIETVNYEFVTEAGTRLAGLKSGQYDLITNLAPQDVDEAPAFAEIQGQEHPIIILNADAGITADPNVRKALNLAVDKEAIVEQVYGGYAAVDPGQLLSESIVGFNEDLEAYPYDPDEAKSLIEEAGVAGETITLVGESSGRWLNDRELVEAVASYWTEAGLNVDLQTPGFDEYLDVLFDRDTRADAIFVSSSNDLLDADRQLSTFYQAGGIGASNSDEELAALIDQARAELDPEARAPLYNEAVQLAYDQAYFVWLVNNKDLYGLSERIEWTPRVDSKLLVKEMSITG
ncbi:MAG TPA: ABC transporter substrate-binding protein [Acidimicrobiales bacterium]